MPPPRSGLLAELSAPPTRAGDWLWDGQGPQMLNAPADHVGMARLRSLRSQLYRAARDLANVQAAEKGPSSYGRRVIRRAAYRGTNRAVGRFLRGLGL